MRSSPSSLLSSQFIYLPSILVRTTRPAHLCLGLTKLNHTIKLFMQVLSLPWHLPPKTSLRTLFSGTSNLCLSRYYYYCYYYYPSLINHEFSRQIFEKQISNFTKIRPVEPQLFLADGQTDMTKLMVPFRNSAHAPKATLLYTTVHFYVSYEPRNKHDILAVGLYDGHGIC